MDVPKEVFVEKVEEREADLLGPSTLLTTTVIIRCKSIEELEKVDLPDRVKIMVGGAPVSGKWANSTGADNYAEDAMAVVKLAKRMVQ